MRLIGMMFLKSVGALIPEFPQGHIVLRSDGA